MRKKINRILLMFSLLLTVASSVLFAISTHKQNATTDDGTLVTVASVSPTTFTLQNVICLDAGHGGEDGGAEYNGRNENEDIFDLTMLVGSILEENYNYSIIYTRVSDVYLTNANRAEYANELGADILISFHRNSFDGYEEVNGVEAWIHSSSPDADYTLASSILESIFEYVPDFYDRGVKSGTLDGDGEYAINRISTMPSCILELGFISSYYDNYLFDMYYDELALAIAEGIDEYFNTIN